MGRVLSSIDEETKQFIQSQHMFFIATAPLAIDGHINVSPKGLDTLRVLSPSTVAYLDLTGSGIETVAHIQENERVVLMFCAFQEAPKILRLHGRGRVLYPSEAKFQSLEACFPKYPGTRSLVVIEVTRVSQSCGFGVPFYQYEGERSQLQQWAHNKGEEGLDLYRKSKNSRSIDGLAGVSVNNPVATR